VKIPAESIAPRISLVIPTFNRADQLVACLQSLSRDFPADGEVIIVSDGGDRDQFPELHQFQDVLNLTVMHVEHRGPSHARNQGLERVRAPIVLFLDDDCLVQPGWLERLAASVSLAPPIAAAGKTLNGLPESVCASTEQLILDISELNQHLRNEEPLYYPSNNIAFPVAQLRQLGGFDTNFRTSEDRELCRRWSRAGYRMVKATDAVIKHAPRSNLTRFWRKYVAYGEGAARFHEASPENWFRESVAYHLCIPGLAARQIKQHRLKRGTRIFALLALWEIATVVGYLRHKWARCKFRRIRNDRRP